MHLKFEGKWVYLLIVPAIILAMVLVLALVPDQAMRPVDTDAEETVQFTPLQRTFNRSPGAAASPGIVWSHRSSHGVA
jgi:cytochrome c oxidase subunit 4